VTRGSAGAAAASGTRHKATSATLTLSGSVALDAGCAASSGWEVISNDGGTSVAQGGGNLIGQDGNDIIGQDGRTAWGNTLFALGSMFSK